jgi:hypothetical protein
LSDRGQASFLAREATIEGRADSLAPDAKIVQQLARPRATFVPHPAR